MESRVIPEKGDKESPFNYLLTPEAQDIVKINVGFGFKRARMKDAYAILKGRDVETRKYSENIRIKQFEIFKDAQSKAIDNTNWHTFLKILLGLGFKSGEILRASSPIINAYILYLIGKYDLKMNYKILDNIIARWFFMSNLTVFLVT